MPCDAVLLAPGTYRGEVLLAERFSADGSEMLIAGDESGHGEVNPVMGRHWGDKALGHLDCASRQLAKALFHGADGIGHGQQRFDILAR